MFSGCPERSLARRPATNPSLPTDRTRSPGTPGTAGYCWRKSRNHTRHVHLQRQMAGLRCKHLAALLALGVMHRDATLATLDEHHERDDRHGQQADADQGEDVDVTLTGRLERLTDGARQACNDTSEDQHRDAVADTAFGDLLAQPHHEHGTSHEGGDSHEVEAEVVGEATPAQANGHADGLDQCQDYSTVAGVLADLATPRLTLFLQLLQLRADSGHELHDDRCRDVRHDPQCKDTHALQRAAGKHVEEAKNGPLVLPEQCRQAIGVDARNWDVRADPIDDDRQEQETQTCPELGQTAVA